MGRQDKKLKNGSMLGPYRIIRLIGEGGMGEVYQAHDGPLNRTVALKIISPKIHEAKEIVKRFMSEGQALARLNHQNVVLVYTLGEEAGIHYIVMEYVDGSSLHDMVKTRGTLNIDESIGYFKQLLEGVKALHGNGIIHRDLKPKNIIIRKDNSVKIVDFGIAKIEGQTEQETTTGAMVGSIYYVAPEVIEGEVATVQSDIWSLGINLYEMLVGKNPWESSAWGVVVKKITEDEMQFPSDVQGRIPEGLRRIILKMCEKKNSRRYSCIDEVIRDLEAFKSQSGRAIPEIPNQTITDFHIDTLPRSINVKNKIMNSVVRGTSEVSGARLGAAIALVMVLLSGAWYFRHSLLSADFSSQSGEPDLTGVVATAPGNGQKVWIQAHGSVALEWKGILDPPSLLQIARDIHFKDLVHQELNPKSPHLVSQLADGVYFWRLAREKSGKLWPLFEASTFFVVTQTPPQQIYPVNQFVAPEAQPIKFYWNEKTGAHSYRFQLATEISFENIITDDLLTEARTSPLTLPEGDYYWRVRAEDPAGASSAWSEGRSVRVQKLIASGNQQRILASPAPAPSRALKREVALPKRRVSRPAKLPPKNLPVQQLGTPMVSQALQKQILNFAAGKSPRNPASATRPLNPPVLSWNPVPGSASYEVQISSNPDFSKIIWKKSTNSESVKWESAEAGKFHWRVRALKTPNSSGPYTNANIIELNLPAPRVRRSYIHKLDRSKPASARVDWELIPTAQGYQVLVSEKMNFNPVQLEMKSTRNVASVPIRQSGTYYVKVAPLGKTGEKVGDFSKVALLKVTSAQTEPAAGGQAVPAGNSVEGPKLKLPPDGVSVVSFSGKIDPISFRWEAIEGADTYHLEVSSNPKFSKLLHQDILRDNQIILTKKFPKGKIFWRVRAEGRDFKTGWSPASHFEIGN